jgi:hypothetical protein
MNPGQLDTSVTLLRHDTQRAASGAIETILVEAGEPWVKLRVLPARQQIAAGAAGRILSAYELTARTPDLAQLNAEDTGLVGQSVSVLNHIHDIVAAVPYQDNPRSGYTVLTVVRRSPQPQVGTT